MKDILYNLPFIHRAYCLTYTSESKKELFIPIRKHFFVQRSKSKETWFAAELDPEYSNGHILNEIQNKFERDPNFPEGYTVRYKKRFNWLSSDKERIKKFECYHRKLRQDINYIAGLTRLWYIKRDSTNGVIQKNQWYCASLPCIGLVNFRGMNQ